MDQWLTAVERDHKRASVSRQKIVRDKPSGLTDECFDGAGQKVSNSLCPAGVVDVEGTPRTVAGDPLTTDANKCQLQPLNRVRLRRRHVHRGSVEPAAADLPQRCLQLLQARR